MEVGTLPVELWQLILSYLRLPDLGRCSLVCRAWSHLVLSLDKTRWRQLCLGFLEHRHPNWPNQPHVEPPSWREAFKQHFLASKTWTTNTQDRRRKGRRQLRIGVGGEFGSLKAALAAASPYDCLVLLPGVHEEQGQVVLTVMGPGTCQVKFCTFSQSSIHLHSVATCILENCEFTGSENASVTVEGCPSSDHNWACKHLAALAKSCAVSVQDSASQPALLWPSGIAGDNRCWSQ